LKVGEGTRIFEPVTFVHKEEVNIGKNCTIGQYCFVGTRNLTLMDEVEICPQVTISGGGDVHIGEGATICYGARIIPSTMDKKFKYMNDIVRSKNPLLSNVITGSIRIEEGVYIGSNVVVCVSKKCPNIVIGKHSVIGANAFISESIPPNTIVHPVKNLVMKKRFEDASP